jgi:hypothetical protein
MSDTSKGKQKGLKHEGRRDGPASDRTRTARTRRTKVAESKHTKLYCNKTVHSEHKRNEGEGDMNPV